MATQAIDRSADLPPYTAMVWSQFQACPPLMYNLFESTVRPGEVSHTSDTVFDMSGARLSHKLSELTVKNVEELHRLTNDLLRMPILFRIKVQHEKVEHYVVMKVRKKWTDEFAVLVNTRHPAIRELMSLKLAQAMQLMQEGKNFCIKFDFGPSVRQWYSGIVDSEVTFCDNRSNSDSGHMEVWVTNYTTPMECCFSPVCILCCFPFWLLCGGPCYVGHRKYKCIDIDQAVRDLPVTLLTGVPTTVTIHHIPQPQNYPVGPPPPAQNYPRGPAPPAQNYPRGPAPPPQNYPMGAPPPHQGPPPAYPGHQPPPYSNVV